MPRAAPARHESNVAPRRIRSRSTRAHRVALCASGARPHLSNRGSTCRLDARRFARRAALPDQPQDSGDANWERTRGHDAIRLHDVRSATRSRLLATVGFGQDGRAPDQASSSIDATRRRSGRRARSRGPAASPHPSEARDTAPRRALEGRVQFLRRRAAAFHRAARLRSMYSPTQPTRPPSTAASDRRRRCRGAGRAFFRQRSALRYRCRTHDRSVSSRRSRSCSCRARRATARSRFSPRPWGRR